MICEEELVKIEKAFEDAKAERMKSKLRLAAWRGKFHSQLVARREAGENLTIPDMKAMEDAAIDDNQEISTAYAVFIAADATYRLTKVTWESAKRQYWDGKPRHL